MKKIILNLIIIIFGTYNLNATHVSGADLTYECLGGNNYEITFTFYRDCSAGSTPNGSNAGAPLTANINIQSISCSQNFTASLPKVLGSGQEITPICPSIGSACGSNNVYYGVQEHVYQDVVTLTSCTDWVISFSHCCRSDPITTIISPGSQDMYIEALLDNSNAPCNSSPVFLNKPIFVLNNNQAFSYNPGAIDPDGDSLSFELFAPYTSNVGDSVIYIPGYSGQQFLNSSPAITIDPISGDIFVSPTIQEISVTGVLVKEWRNIGSTMTVIGSVLRDIMVLVINSTNHHPVLAGINPSSTQYNASDTIFSINHYAGIPLSFKIYPFDVDLTQNLNLSWNSAIAAFTWSVIGNGTTNPVGCFSWNPLPSDISTYPYYFTVSVYDDACPYNGTQERKYCIAVNELGVDIGNDTTICCNQSIILDAGQGYSSYQWSTSDTTQTITIDSTGTGIGSATYIVDVTYNPGYIASDTITVNFVLCTGINDHFENTNIILFPNPSEGIINITLKEMPRKYDLAIINTYGQIVHQEKLNMQSEKYEIKLDLSKFPKGTYILKISDEEKSYTRKLVLK